MTILPIRPNYAIIKKRYRDWKQKERCGIRNLKTFMSYQFARHIDTDIGCDTALMCVCGVGICSSVLRTSSSKPHHDKHMHLNTLW